MTTLPPNGQGAGSPPATIPIPTAFPSSDPQALAHVTVSQVQSTAALVEGALARLREKQAGAMAETTVEFQAFKALEAVGPLLQVLISKL
jgi:hypothetical protein